MQQDDLRTLLTGFAAERVALLQRHEAGARVVSHYDFNNTYQYVISREETHLTWLGTALGELGQSLPPAGSAIPVPAVSKSGRKATAADVAATFRGVLDDDAQGLATFVTKWRPQVAHMTHARHRTMLDVILGESMEHSRLFAQASGGFEDVLGRRTAGSERVGAVLPTRWQE